MKLKIAGFWGLRDGSTVSLVADAHSWDPIFESLAKYGGNAVFRGPKDNQWFGGWLESPKKSTIFRFFPQFSCFDLTKPPMFGQICKFPQIFFPALHPLQTKFSETLPAGALRGRAPISSIAKRTSCFEKTPLAPDAVRMPPYKARPLELPKCGLNQHGTLVPLQSFPFIPDSYLYKFIWDHPQEHTHIF